MTTGGRDRPSRAPDPGVICLALFGPDARPDRKTRQIAYRRLLSTGEGLVFAKSFSPCLQTNVNAQNGHMLAYEAGRRSVLIEIVDLALAPDVE